MASESPQRLCLVTGSTAGIGKAIAIALAQQGHKVIVNGRSAARVDPVVDELRALDGVAAESVVGVAADVGTAEGCAALCEQVDALGALDVLVNNVGVFEVKAFGDLTDEDWERTFNINVMSCVRLTRHYLPRMLAADSNGRILLISSECGMRPLPHMAAYSVSKAAQINLARGLAEQAKGSTVTVNSVLPGPTMTEGVQTYINDLAASKGQTPAETEAAYFRDDEPTSLLARFLRPEEVAAVVAFLASVASSGINGAAQKVEGGVIRSI